MQLLQVGKHQIFSLELDPDLLRQGAEETGFRCSIEDSPRFVTLDLTALEREGPLLLFDASDSSNTGWFSRCQFYVDGNSGAVLQTPFSVANKREAGGRLNSKSLKLQIRKEVPSHFRFPGKQPVNERVLYSVLFSFLTALQKSGVGLCRPAAVVPLAGKMEKPAGKP